jgi:hypothetical protein
MISPRYNDILSEIKTTGGRLEWLLDEFPELKNKDYNYLVAKFWSIFHNIQVSPEYIASLTQVETISRCKRKLVEKYPEKYGSTKAEHIKNKEKRFVAFQEFAVQDKMNLS